MTLRLVSSGDGPALAIRDHVLPLIRERGTLEVQRDAVRLIVLRTEALTFEHWTPFNDLAPGDAASPGYRHALTHQHTQADLPYGLDVWRAELRVMRLLWADDGAFNVVDFIRGEWEADALALRGRGASARSGSPALHHTIGFRACHISLTCRPAIARPARTGKDSGHAQPRSPTRQAALSRGRALCAGSRQPAVSPSRTLHCRTVAGGRFRLSNHIRELPPIVLDEPGGLPGPDPTPQPLDILLAALGSCLASAIRANAAARGITLSGLALDVEADLAAAALDEAHPPPLGFDEVRVAVHINANAPREVLAALVARATLRSQVASTLHDGTQITVALSSPADP